MAEDLGNSAVGSDGDVHGPDLGRKRIFGPKEPEPPDEPDGVSGIIRRIGFGKEKPDRKNPRAVKPPKKERTPAKWRTLTAEKRKELLKLAHERYHIGDRWVPACADLVSMTSPTASVFLRSESQTVEEALWEIIARNQMLTWVLGEGARSGPYADLAQVAVGMALCAAADHDRLPDTHMVSAMWSALGIDQRVRDYIAAHPDEYVPEEEKKQSLASVTPIRNPFQRSDTEQ